MGAWILPWVVLAVTAVPVREPVAAGIDVQVEVESLQLAADLAEHAAARQREQQASRRVQELGVRIDRRMVEDPPSLLELGRLEDELASERAVAFDLGARTRTIRQRIYERWQRITLLGEARDRYLGGRVSVADGLSGRWQLVMMPSGQRGTMELRLDGTLVVGSYELQGGFSGSLRGTLVAGKLTLERIDSERGFDAVFEGRLEQAAGSLAGAWRTTRLDGSNYGGGDWSAARLQESDNE